MGLASWGKHTQLVTKGEVVRRAARGAGWTLCGDVIGRTSTLVSTIEAARLLGEHDFGGLALIQGTVFLFVALSGHGIGLIVLKFVSESYDRDKVRAGEILGSAILVLIGLGCACTSCLWILARLVAHDILGRGVLAEPLRLASFILLLAPATVLFTSALSAMRCFRPRSLLVAIHGMLDACGILTGSVAGGLVGAVVGYVLAEALTACIGFLLTLQYARRSDLSISWNLDCDRLWTMFRFGLPAAGASMLLSMATWIGQLILVHQLGGLQMVATFAIANRWYLVVQFLPSTLSVVALPLLSFLWNSGDRTQYRQLLKVVVISSFVLVTVGALVAIIFARWILLLEGPSVRNYEASFDVLVLAAIPTAVSSVLGQAAIAMHQTSWWIASDVVLALVVSICAILMVPRLGVVGLSASYAIGFVATNVAIAPAFRLLGRVNRGVIQSP